VSSQKLPTGIDVLDRQLNGGLPGGSVVAYRAPPDSQGELLLFELTRARDTLYLTTDRTEQAVTDTLESTPVADPDTRVKYVAGDAPLENAKGMFRDLGENSNLIIDPVDILEGADRTRYRKFLNSLQNHMHNTGSVAVLHCLDGEHPPKQRDTTMHMADAVFDLRMQYDGADVETQLAVPKFRGGNSLSETVKLELGDRVRIDTSRDIA
jgi:KaiC/GvpD/RAD55 family RecA-like ATPase